MILPTNGCVVWFSPATADLATTQLDKQQWLMGAVVHVFNSRLVNLIVADSNGVQSPRLNVPLLQDNDPVPAGGFFCAWQPTAASHTLATAAVATQLTSGVS